MAVQVPAGSLFDPAEKWRSNTVEIVRFVEKVFLFSVVLL